VSLNRARCLRRPLAEHEIDRFWRNLPQARLSLQINFE
jgi:hypothetical protein